MKDITAPQPAINVLVSSLSKKIPMVKAVQSGCQRMATPGKVYGGDYDAACIGRYFVNGFWMMPKLSELSIETLLDYCRTHAITAIIPTRDGELMFYATHQQRLAEQGISVMVSSADAVTTCLDKLLFFQTLHSQGYPVIETALSLDDLSQHKSFVVKERFGAGALKVGIHLTREQAVLHAQNLENPIFQPFILGRELSVDVYLDKTGKAKGVIARSRDVVANGESQVTTSLKHPTLEALCVAMAEALNLYGHVLFQVFESPDSSKFHVIECNPRFGGASTLSLAMGLDSFYWFLLESQGKDLSDTPFVCSPHEKTQVRYNEDKILS